MFSLFSALLLDLLIGDPRKFPHLVKVIGILIDWYEGFFNSKFQRSIFSGVLFYLSINFSILITCISIRYLLYEINAPLAYLFEVFIIYQCVAARDLYVHVCAILNSLRKGDLLDARKKLSRIVGRDTKGLSESEISRATIESLAESSSDGVIAPIFWTILFGMPGAIIYRTSNTLDSIVGHRDKKYENFGKCSARMDDLLNLCPARITAILLSGKVFILKFWKISKDAKKHRSPNAGWPEAAIAHTLNIRLGGNNFYKGKVLKGPIFNSNANLADQTDIEYALKKCIFSYFYVLVFCMIFTFL